MTKLEFLPALLLIGFKKVITPHDVNNMQIYAYRKHRHYANISVTLTKAYNKQGEWIRIYLNKSGTFNNMRDNSFLKFKNHSEAYSVLMDILK